MAKPTSFVLSTGGGGDDASLRSIRSFARPQSRGWQRNRAARISPRAAVLDLDYFQAADGRTARPLRASDQLRQYWSRRPDLSLPASVFALIRPETFSRTKREIIRLRPASGRRVRTPSRRSSAGRCAVRDRHDIPTTRTDFDTQCSRTRNQRPGARCERSTDVSATTLTDRSSPPRQQPTPLLGHRTSYRTRLHRSRAGSSRSGTARKPMRCGVVRIRSTGNRPRPASRRPQDRSNRTVADASRPVE